VGRTLIVNIAKPIPVGFIHFIADNVAERSAYCRTD
jgi:hypothetical protein